MREINQEEAVRSPNLVSFDYAIKYLLREESDYEILEGFLSALLKTIGYKAIKVVALVDPESNKEQKQSTADMLVKDEDGVHYMIEVDSR